MELLVTPPSLEEGVPLETLSFQRLAIAHCRTADQARAPAAAGPSRRRRQHLRLQATQAAAAVAAVAAGLFVQAAWTVTL